MAVDPFRFRGEAVADRGRRPAWLVNCLVVVACLFAGTPAVAATDCLRVVRGVDLQRATIRLLRSQNRRVLRLYLKRAGL